jgi:uncharacterized SAM-dependent methyltransferase
MQVGVNLFISYSRDDGGDLARHLRQYLLEKNYQVFLDSGSLTVGAKWKPRIETAIDTCDVFVLIITPNTMKSTDVRDEYAAAIDKRKVLMLFKYKPVEFTDLQWGLNERNLIEFETKEELVRIFDNKFIEIDNLLTRDLKDPLVVQAKLIELKTEFDHVSEEIDAIKSYADDVFIPIVTFLRKSPVFYEPERSGIEDILGRATKLSLNIDEKRETSEEVFVKIDADVLRLNLSRFLDYLLTFFVRNTPEMRSQQLQSTSPEELEERIPVEPIATEERDFLSISVDRDLSENLKYEYFKQDIENQRIDIKFFFLGPDSVDLWFKIITRSEYKFFENGRENIKKNASELIDVILENCKPAIGHVDFVDLGVGAAVKDYYLLKAMLEKMPESDSKSDDRMNYVPIDYSIGILQRTMDYMDDLMESYPNKLHIEGILGDFFRLVRYNKRINELSNSPKVFALLGNILGNVDETRFLIAITRTMNPNDLFLLEVDLLDNRSVAELKVGYGSDDVTKNFLLYPILKHFKAENKKTRMTIEEFELHVDVRDMLSIVPNSRTVVTSALYGEDRTEKIDLVQSHKYDLQSLLNYLYSVWKLAHIKTYKEKSACLLLLKKLPIERKQTISPAITEPQLAKNFS